MTNVIRKFPLSRRDFNCHRFDSMAGWLIIRKTRDKSGPRPQFKIRIVV